MAGDDRKGIVARELRRENAWSFRPEMKQTGHSMPLRSEVAWCPLHESDEVARWSQDRQAQQHGKAVAVSQRLIWSILRSLSTVLCHSAQHRYAHSNMFTYNTAHDARKHARTHVRARAYLHICIHP